MDNENGTETDAQNLPDIHVTVNQVVAWNMAYWREQAGLKQRELGDRIGWTNTAVSEAERSWAGKRTREFDAPTTVAIAQALGVPLLAMYLPPADDGLTARYLVTIANGEERDMSALMAAIMPENNSDSAVMDAYRERLLVAAEGYLAPDWAADVGHWLGAADEKELNADRAIRLRRRLGVLEELLEEFTEVADRLEEASQ